MKSKLTNLIYTFMGNATFSFIKWLILILIVRLTNTEQVGIYTFAIALTTPIVLLVNMRLRLRYVVEDNLSFVNLKYLRNILNLISLVIITIITLIFFKEYLVIVILVAATKLLDLNSELYYGFYHKKSMFKNISLLMIVKSALVILSFGAVLIVTKNLVLSMIAQLIVQFIWLVLAEKKTQNFVDEGKKTSFNFNIIWGIFLAGIPLGIVQLLNSYNILIPRYVIEDKLSITAIGIFAAISYLLTIIDIFMNAISQNFIVSIKSKIKNNQFSKLRKFILRDVLIASVVLGGVVVITSYLFGDKIINIIYGSGYADKSYILTIVAISIIFNFQGWMYDTTLMALERYKIQLFASFITLLASITASLLLIPNYGLLGASLAIVVITFIQSTIKLVVIMSIMIKKGAVK